MSAAPAGRRSVALTPPFVASAAALVAGVGLALAYLGLLGHLGEGGLTPGALGLRLGGAITAVLVLFRWRAGAAIAWVERAELPAETARRALLAWPRSCALLLVALWLAAGGLAVASLRPPADVLLHVAVDLIGVPAVLAGVVALFVFEEAARAHVDRLLPGGRAGDAPSRLRRRLVLALLSLSVGPVALLGSSLWHVLELHDVRASSPDALVGHAGAAGHEAHGSPQRPAPLAVRRRLSAHDHAALLELVAFVALAAGAAAAVVGVLVARSIAVPVGALARALARVREGELGTRLAVTSDDELGLAAEAYNGMAEGLTERAWLRETFGRYVSHEVADALREKRIELAGEDREVSVLFADVREFTRLSEGMPPRDVLAFVNAYLAVMIPTIASCGGRVDKVMGDGIMAVFGAPLADPEHARHAIDAALGMRAALAGFNLARTGQGQPSIRIGIGVHSGVVTAGNVGTSDHKLEYTVLGDAVNLASRLEGLTKELGCDVLVSDATARAAGEAFVLEARGAVAVRGKSAPVETYAVTGRKPPVGAAAA